MPWQFQVARAARRDLSSMPERDRQAVGRAFNRLIEDPTAVDLAKLSGRDQWRLRVGRWRAILEMDAETGTITVVRVLPRSEGTSR
jgi:mRNA interferase RelE/StbE